MKNTALKIAFFVIIALNIYGFSIMGIDKGRAQRKEWRIPEKQLFTVAALGGSTGILGGMYYFRHKTRHPSFTFGVPILLLFNILTWYILLKKLKK